LNSGKAHSEFQRFLRQKGVDYSETPSCLKVSLPVSILGGSQSTTWADIDNAFVPLFINKVTGNIVCPRLGLVGSWTQVQEVIETWLKNRTRAKGDEEASYPKLQKIELKLPTKVEKIWEAATPVDKLTNPQFNELLRNFRQVQRDFNQEDFSRFDARVETGSHDKLYFPVRYLGRELVGLRVVRVVGNRLEEEDLRLMLVTETLFGLRASSQVMSSFTGALSIFTCSNMHSRKALLLSTMDRNLGSVLSQPAMFLSSSSRKLMSSASMMPELFWSRHLKR